MYASLTCNEWPYLATFCAIMWQLSVAVEPYMAHLPKGHVAGVLLVAAKAAPAGAVQPLPQRVAACCRRQCLARHGDARQGLCVEAAQHKLNHIWGQPRECGSAAVADWRCGGQGCLRSALAFGYVA